MQNAGFWDAVAGLAPGGLRKLLTQSLVTDPFPFPVRGDPALDMRLPVPLQLGFRLQCCSSGILVLQPLIAITRRLDCCRSKVSSPSSDLSHAPKCLLTLWPSGS